MKYGLSEETYDKIKKVISNNTKYHFYYLVLEQEAITKRHLILILQLLEILQVQKNIK